VEFEYCGQVNGRCFDRVVILPSGLKTYGKVNQPPQAVVMKVFVDDILPTLSNYQLASTYDEVRREPIFHAVSCTSSQIGFSTGYRDTIMKVKENTLVVFHHNIRTKNQYVALMQKFYPDVA